MRCAWCDAPTDETGPEPICRACRAWLRSMEATLKASNGAHQEEERTEGSRPALGLHIRSATTRAGTRFLEAAAVPIGIPTAIPGQRGPDGGDLVEQFDPGAFAAAIDHPGEVALADGHGRDRASTAVVGRGTRFAEVWADPGVGYLGATFRLARTHAADEVWSLVRDGFLRDVSIAFAHSSRSHTVTHATRHGAVNVEHWTDVSLLHCALVDRGAYHGVAEVLHTWEDAPPSVRDLEALSARLRLDPVTGAAPPAPAPPAPPQRLSTVEARRLRLRLHGRPGGAGFEELSPLDLERLERLLRRRRAA